MKKILPAFFFLCIINTSRAQNWALPSSTWLCTYFVPFPPWLTYPYTAKVVGDTVVDNISCTKIYQGISPTHPLLTYSSNDTVFFYRNGAFYPCYYFNAQMGDTVSYLPAALGCVGNSAILAVVTSIDSIVLNNQTLRSFHTSIIQNSAGLGIYDTSLVYTEKIGSNSIEPYFLSRCAVDEDTYGICDYGDSTITGFYAYLNSNCLTDIEETGMDNSALRISPNPATTSFTITIDETLLNSTLTITDITGRKIEDVLLTTGNTELPTAHLANGIYLITINSGRQTASKKLVVGSR